MKKTIALIFVIFFNILAFKSFSVLTCEAQTLEVSPIIFAVEIKGNQKVSEREIMDAVFTRPGERIVEEKIKGDLKAIYALGYFADVSATFETTPKGAKVIFQVSENPLITSIIFEGNSAVSSAELSSIMNTKKGDILNYKRLQEDIEKINNYYKQKGYLLARIVDVNTNEKTGTLTFKIIEGIVEAITLEGNETTKDYVILRELKTKPGSVLNEEILKKDLRRVFNLGFFSEVTPNFEPGSTKDKVVLQLKVKETRTSTINFGGGYGEREGWFGFIDLSINNLLGTAQGLLLRGQSGQQLQTYQFKYYNPWLWPERLGERAAFTFRRWLTIGRDIFLTTQDGIYNGFDLSLGKPLSDYYNISYTLGSENVSPYGSSSFEAYRSDTIGMGLAFDTRDFWLNPKEGRYYTIDLKQGWKHASSSTSFFKLGGDINHYIPIFENQILALHLGVGAGFGDVPVGELYWAGGANTVRGLSAYDAKKGTRKLIFNAEYRFNFSDLFQGVLFYDWGNAWGAEEKSIPWEQFPTGWGPGLRLNTPLGPIRLDWGVPGGKSFGEGIMHFSIGQAF